MRMDEPKHSDKELLGKIEMQVTVGEFDQALSTLRDFNKYYPYRMETRPLYKQIANQKHIMDEALRYLNLNSFSKALKKLRLLSSEFPACNRIRLLMIECLIRIQGVTDDAEVYFDQLSDVEYLYVDELQNKCLKFYIRSLINYYNCEFEAAIENLEDLFSLDDAHVRGRELEKKVLDAKMTFQKVECYNMKNEELDECINCLSQAMKLEPSNQALNRTLLVNIAATYVKMLKVAEAEKVLEQLRAMGVNPRNIELQKITEKIRCIKVVGQAGHSNNDHNFKNLKLPDYQLAFIAEDFRKLLSIVTQMNIYQILGLDSTSQLTQTQVEQASRQLIKRYHPDNYASNYEIQVCCVEIFQHIKRAEQLMLKEISNRLKPSIA